MAEGKQMPGNSQMRRQGKRMVEWFRKELGLSAQAPVKHRFWETNLFWGGLGLGVTFMVGAFEFDAPWLLILAWPFFVCAFVATFRNVQSKRKRWSLTVVSSLMIAALLLGIDLRLWRDPFAGEVELRVFSKGNGHVTGFWITYNRDNRCFISPIDTLLFVRITNLKSRNTMITGYQAEVRDGDKWKRLNKIDMRNFRTLFTMLKGSPKLPNDNARAITLPPGAILLDRPWDDYAYDNAGIITVDLLDSQLGTTNMSPGGSIRGWVAFDYSHQILDMRNEVRLTLIDERGNRMALTLPINLDKEHANLLEHGLIVGPLVDVSGCVKQSFPF